MAEPVVGKEVSDASPAFLKCGTHFTKNEFIEMFHGTAEWDDAPVKVSREKQKAAGDGRMGAWEAGRLCVRTYAVNLNAAN